MKFIRIFSLIAFFSLLGGCKNNSTTLSVSSDPKEDPSLFMQNILLADAKAEQPYEIILKDTYIYWRGEMLLGLKKHEGTIHVSGGELELKGNQISKGDFLIDMNSFKCTDIKDPEINEKFIAHLRSDDFLDVENFAFAKFKILDFVQNESVTLIDGILTIRGYSNKVRFSATTHRKGDEFRLVSDEFFIDRSIFDISYNIEDPKSNLTSIMIKNKVAIRVHLRARKKNTKI